MVSDHLNSWAPVGIFWVGWSMLPAWASQPWLALLPCCLPKSPWQRWMISSTGPTICPAMINPCDDIPPKYQPNQCTLVINDEDGDHDFSIHAFWNLYNPKKQWRRAKLAEIVRETLIRCIYSLSCVLLQTKNKQPNFKLKKEPPKAGF